MNEIVGWAPPSARAPWGGWVTHARPTAGEVLGRCVGYGAVAGASAGGLFGTAVAPIIGTLFGAVIGSVVGLLLGLLASAVVVPMVQAGAPFPAVVVATALTAGTVGAALALVLGLTVPVVAVSGVACALIAGSLCRVFVRPVVQVRPAPAPARA